MKTVGIVGGLDFLGCDITLKFLAENYFVKVLDLPRPKHNPPLISTSLKAGDNLKIFSIDQDNPLQMSIFLKGCDFLIHCGRPFKLDVKMAQGSLYVPVITDSGCLLRVLSKSPAIKKVIFLTSVAILNLYNMHTFSEPGQKINKISDSAKFQGQKATFHSEKIISRTMKVLSGNRLEIVHVSPVIVWNNMLTNSRETTLAGLQYIFRNKIDHDTVFQKLNNRNLVDTMINADELPGKIFSSVREFKLNAKPQVSL